MRYKIHFYLQKGYRDYTLYPKYLYASSIDMTSMPFFLAFSIFVDVSSKLGTINKSQSFLS